MRWRRDWSARPPRSNVRRLAADEQKKLLAQMAEEIARSPALSGFGVQRSGSEDLESGPWSREFGTAEVFRPLEPVQRVQRESAK
jgi:hypothetical protein